MTERLLTSFFVVLIFGQSAGCSGGGNGGGSGNVVGTSPPEAPSGLIAAPVSSSKINLSWLDNAWDESGFKIERKTGVNGTYVQIGATASNMSVFTDSNLAASTTYYYRVLATNSAGDSSYTLETSTSTLPILLPKTGQVTSYATGDDGATQRGVSWPAPRFIDYNDGTVTDKLTGLVWLKDSKCYDIVAGIGGGALTWADALSWSNGLSSGKCGLSDGSVAGDWRLPNRKEIQSLVDRSSYNPALPAGHPFNADSSYYWTSTPTVGDYVYYIGMYDGFKNYGNGQTAAMYVWPVRVSASDAAATIQLAKTGETLSLIAGDDGAIQKGVEWPSPRFTDNSDGTVRDNLTGLIWLKNANCTETLGGISMMAGNSLSWANAIAWSNALADGACGLTDGSSAGQWKLPNIAELESLELMQGNYTLPHPFVNVQGDWYWSSSSYTANPSKAWYGSIGGKLYFGEKSYLCRILPIRIGP